MDSHSEQKRRKIPSKAKGEDELCGGGKTLLFVLLGDLGRFTAVTNRKHGMSLWCQSYGLLCLVVVVVCCGDLVMPFALRFCQNERNDGVPNGEAGGVKKSCSLLRDPF